jgi:rhamnosyltransferase
LAATLATWHFFCFYYFHARQNIHGACTKQPQAINIGNRQMTNTPPRVAIVMRSYNDADVIRQTLDGVMAQHMDDYELWNFDSNSDDGTLDIIRQYNESARIHLNDSAQYNPGRVLNEAVSITNSDILVFLNSDATPTDPFWLDRLIEPLSDPHVGASFGQQSPRPDCRSLFIKDTQRAFGDGSVAASWPYFYSMANAAVSREVATHYPFETRVQYSEDIEWSYRMRCDSLRIAYVEGAGAIHSHNYNLSQSYRRQRGEGLADAWIFRQGEIDGSFLRYCLLPMSMEIARDLRWAVTQRSADALLHTIPLRIAQKYGRWQGLRQGVHHYGN